MVEPTGYTALDLIGFTDRGPYDPTANYVRNDLVHVGNSTWRCKIDDTTGITPTEGANWTIFIESATSLAGMSDVNIITPTEGDGLAYDGTAQKWKNSHDELSAIENVYGSKNLCPIESRTISGFTFAPDKNGYMTCSTSSDNRLWSYALSNQFFRLKAGTYFIKAFEKTAYTTGYVGLQIIDSNGNSIFIATWATLLSTGQTFTLEADTDIGVEYKVGDGAYAFMIMDNRIKDRTYALYTMTNRELTEDKAENSVIGNVENDATASKAYTVGEHFIRNGKYCLVSAAIAQGATLTENTNYIVSNINESNHVCRVMFNGDCDALGPGIVYYGNSGSHAPFNWAIIQTFFASASGTNRVQIAYRSIDFGMAIRYYGAGTWSAWKTVTLS